MAQPIKKIICFARPQVDTIVALYIFKTFGEEQFPGVSTAPIEYIAALPKDQKPDEMIKEGTLVIDLGLGRFDHHTFPGKSVAELVAIELKVDQQKSLRKLLAWAKRDDIEGKGTISADPLDRAFGLSGITTVLARQHKDNPQRVVDLILPLLDAHVAEEKLRQDVLPEEWQRLKKSGDGGEFGSRGKIGAFKVFWARSEQIQLPGFLRAYHHADVIIQQLRTGHVNIITQQNKNIDLKAVVAMLRIAEEVKKKKKITDNLQAFTSPGKFKDTQEWFYDTAANTIQNGGVQPGDIPATRLTLDVIKDIVKAGIQKTFLKQYLEHIKR